MRNLIKWQNPIALAATTMVTTIAYMFIAHWVSYSNDTLQWRAVAVAMLFYAIANQVSGLLSKSWVRYTLISYGSYAVLLTILLVAASHISNTPLKPLFYMTRIYVLITLFFILQTGLAVLFRVMLKLVNGEIKL